MKKALKGAKPSGDMVHKMAIKSVKMFGKPKKKVSVNTEMAMKKAPKKGTTGMKGDIKKKVSLSAVKQAGKGMAGGRLVFNSDNKNTSPEIAQSTPQAILKKKAKKKSA